MPAAWRSSRGKFPCARCLAVVRPHDLDADLYLRAMIRVLCHWPRERYIELAAGYWAKTKGRLAATQLAAEYGPLDIPDAREQQLVSRESRSRVTYARRAFVQRKRFYCRPIGDDFATEVVRVRASTDRLPRRDRHGGRNRLRSFDSVSELSRLIRSPTT